jgi:hypothetical protein
MLIFILVPRWLASFLQTNSTFEVAPTLGMACQRHESHKESDLHGFPWHVGEWNLHP